MKAYELKKGDIFYLISELDSGIRRQHEIVDFKDISNYIKSAYQNLNGLEKVKGKVLWATIGENSEVLKLNVTNKELNELYLNKPTHYKEYVARILYLKNYPVVVKDQMKAFVYAFQLGCNFNPLNTDVIDLIRYVQVK